MEHNNITSVPHLRLREPNTSVYRDTAERSTAANLSEAIDEKIEDVNSKISILEEILYNSDKTERLTDRNVIDVECSQGHFQGKAD